MERYKTEKNIVETDKGLMNEQQLAELNSELVTARNRSADTKSKLDRITAIMHGDVLDATVTEGLSNTVINGLRQKYLEDGQQEAEWSAKFGPDHAAVAQNPRRNEHDPEARSAMSLDGSRSPIRATTTSPEPMNCRSSHACRNCSASPPGPMAIGWRCVRCKARLKLTGPSMRTSCRRYTQAVQDQSFPVSEARVITAATPPLRKSWPQSNLVLGGAGLLGIGLGFLVAFVRETLDRGIRTTAQLRMVTGLNCVGMLPGLGRGRRSRAARGRQPSTADANSRILSSRPDILRHVLTQPASRFSEGIRALALRICRGHQRAMPLNLIGCVSAHQGEGTSTVAANLAQSLARSGNRTLLVDWTSNSGSLSQSLAPYAKQGFLDLLAGSAKLNDLVWTDPDTGLHFLPMGSRTSRAITSMLNGSQAQDFRTELLRHYEYVVFDVPALSPVNEIHAAAQLLDAFVLVVAWGRADPDTTLGALTDAELDDRRFLGAVFNGVDFKSMKSYPGSRSDRQIAALT